MDEPLEEREVLGGGICAGGLFYWQPSFEGGVRGDQKDLGQFTLESSGLLRGGFRHP